MNVTPSLTLKKTLSHPADAGQTGRVLGFTARETMFGYDSLVLKGEQLPVVRDGPAVTHYIIPEQQAEEAAEQDLHIYILAENRVYYVDPLDVRMGEQHTGTKHGQEVDGKKVPVSMMNEWPREQVSVSN